MIRVAKRSRPKAAQRASSHEPGVPNHEPRATCHAPLWGPVLLVGALAVLVYVNGLPGGFVFDDKLIQRDPRIQGQTSLWTIFATDYWYTYIGTSADLYRPLTILSYAFNYKLFGLS